MIIETQANITLTTEDHATAIARKLRNEVEQLQKLLIGTAAATVFSAFKSAGVGWGTFSGTSQKLGNSSHTTWNPSRLRKRGG